LNIILCCLGSVPCSSSLASHPSTVYR